MISGQADLSVDLQFTTSPVTRCPRAPASRANGFAVSLESQPQLCLSCGQSLKAADGPLGQRRHGRGPAARRTSAASAHTVDTHLCRMQSSHLGTSRRHVSSTLVLQRMY